MRLCKIVSLFGVDVVAITVNNCRAGGMFENPGGWRGNHLRSVDFEMTFGVLQFLQKNERKQVNLRFQSSKVEFVCSFFVGNVGLKKSISTFSDL